MTPSQTLLLLRLTLAALLYAFLGALFWLLWRDLRAADHSRQARRRRLGRLVVIRSELSAIPTQSVSPLLPITSLGRAPTNTVSLPDDAISLEHALLHLRNGQWWLEDLASRNGSRLNGAPVIGSAAVAAGDIIALGSLELKVELD